MKRFSVVCLVALLVGVLVLGYLLLKIKLSTKLMM